MAPGLNDLILKLLEVRPSERFQTASEVLEALNQVRQEESASLARTLEQSSVAEHLDLDSVETGIERPVPVWVIVVVLVSLFAAIAWFSVR